MTTAQLTIEQLTSTLDGLYGCEATSNAVEPPLVIEEPRVTACYHDMEGSFRFAMVCELALANSLGAALTMIPPGGAEEATAGGGVPANIADNLHEVANICSAVFADNEHHRIVLDKVFLPGQELPEDVSGKLETAECLLQVDYELQRYSAGKMSLLKVI